MSYAGCQINPIFTSKQVWKFWIKIQLTKSNPKIIREVNPPCLMPIRVKLMNNNCPWRCPFKRHLKLWTALQVLVLNCWWQNNFVISFFQQLLWKLQYFYWLLKTKVFNKLRERFTGGNHFRKYCKQKWKCDFKKSIIPIFK